MTTITQETKIERSAGLLATELDGEIVLLGIEQGAYFGMDKTARRIWEIIEEPKRISEVCDQLSREFEVDGETCQREVLEFVVQLEREGLVVVAAP